MNKEKRSIKVCVSSTDGKLDSAIDPRFGRCAYFILLEIENGEIKKESSIKNSARENPSGAGIGAAEKAGQLGTDVLITGNVGPKAKEILDKLRIKVVAGQGSAKEALDIFLKKELPQRSVKSSKAGARLFIPLLEDKGKASRVSLHFGHAPFFAIYDSEKKELLIKKNELDHIDPEKSPVDQIIEQADPGLVYARDIGSRAIGLFEQKGIKLKTGSYETVGDVIDNMDELQDLSHGCGH